MLTVLATGVVLLFNAWISWILTDAAERHQIFDLGGLLRVLESARAHSYILSKHLAGAENMHRHLDLDDTTQKTCYFWQFTFWLLTVSSALRL